MKRLLGSTLFWSARLDSTQDALSSLIKVCALPGTLLGSDEQERGRGRLGREWVSPKGGLYFSFLLPMDTLPLHLYGFLLPIALVETFDEILVCRLSIRWPNDVVWKGKKLAGVLLEKREKWIVAGVGVNVEVSPRLEDRETVCLRELGWTGSRWEVLYGIMDKINLWIETTEEGIINTYKERVEGIPGKWRVKGRDETFFIKEITDTGMICTDKGVFSYLDLVEMVG